MENKHYKFLIGCIGFRILLALFAKNANASQLKSLGMIALIPAITFIGLYLFDLRKTGVEAGGRIWWNDVRPMHGVLYLLFAIYAIKSATRAWCILALDLVLGLIFWGMKYYLGYFI